MRFDLRFAIKLQVLAGQWLWLSWQNSRFHIRGVQFKSCRKQNVILYLLLSVEKKQKNKEKDSGNGQFEPKLRVF